MNIKNVTKAAFLNFNYKNLFAEWLKSKQVLSDSKTKE